MVIIHQLVATSGLFPFQLFSHGFGLHKTPDLPLNGHESTAFLQDYAETMAAQRDASSRYLAQLSVLAEKAEVAVADDFIDSELTKFALFDQAYMRAATILVAS